MSHSARLVVELDGESHDFASRQSADRVRDAWFESQGYLVLRFANADVLRNLVSRTKKKVVVADNSKIGHVSNWLLCPTAEIDMLITDKGASAEAIDIFKNMGIEVVLV